MSLNSKGSLEGSPSLGASAFESGSAPAMGLQVTPPLELIFWCAGRYADGSSPGIVVGGLIQVLSDPKGVK